MASKDIKRPDKDLVAEALRADVSIRSVEEEDVLLFRPLEEAQRERESIWGLIRTGNRESLLGAFATNSWTAWDLIAVVAASDDPALAALVPELATTLASLLEDQTLKERTVVRLHLREALARTTRDPRERSEAIDIVLREAATLPGNTRAEVLRSVVSSFKPLEVMPNLIRFLPVARRHGPGVLQGFLESIDYLIEHGFAVYDDKPALARDCRDTTLSLVADLLLKDDTLDEWVQEKVAGIVRTRAKTLGGALSSVIEELARVSGASVERIAWSLWGKLLTSPNYAERGWVDPDAAVWFMERPYAWPWRVYDHISRYLHDPELLKHRIKAVKLLGEYGPTSIRDPLPRDVEELRNLLKRLSKEAEDRKLRKEAAAALARNIARGKQQGSETIRQPSLTPEVGMPETAGVDACTQTKEHGKERPAAVSDMPEPVDGTLPARPQVSSDTMAVRALIENLDEELALTRTRLLPKLELLLELMHKAGTLGNYELNAKVVDKINLYVAACLVQLTYTDSDKGLAEAPVNLDCRKKPGYPTGGFRLRRADKTQTDITTKKDFPLLGLLPLLPGTPAVGSPSPGF